MTSVIKGGPITFSQLKWKLQNSRAPIIHRSVLIQNFETFPLFWWLSQGKLTENVAKWPGLKKVVQSHLGGQNEIFFIQNNRSALPSKKAFTYKFQDIPTFLSWLSLVTFIENVSKSLKKGFYPTLGVKIYIIQIQNNIISSSDKVYSFKSYRN